MSRPIVAQIDLQAIKHNYNVACVLNNGPCYAVVKANGYGNGAVEVAKALVEVAYGFAVASIEEAVELRTAGIQNRILLLEGIFEVYELKCVVKHNLDMVFHTASQFKWFENELFSFTACHAFLKINTGMHRLGLDESEVIRLLSMKRKFQKVGVMTHLACADEFDNQMNHQQIQKFNRILDVVPCDMQSALNSAGLCQFTSQLSSNVEHIGRPGIMLYGSNPCYPHAIKETLKPVMSLQSSVIAVQKVLAGASVGYGQIWRAPEDTYVAVVACGYADGYPRHAKTGTPVMINGRSYRLVGRVSMDMLTVEVDSQVKEGDSVELWGKYVDIDEVAAYADTISYELMTKVTARVKKEYI